MSVPKEILNAILQDNVPGEFGPDRMRFDFPVLVSQKASGAKLFWQIQVGLVDTSDNRTLSMTPERLGDPPYDSAGMFLATSWQEGGEPRKGTTPTYVRSGKNLGRANATNQLTQAFKEAWSKYNDKLRKGARQANPSGEQEQELVLFTNPPPMLVQKYGATKDSLVTDADLAAGVFVQKKFNGVRAAVRLNKEADGVVIYSRTGEEYKGLVSLRRELARIMLQLSPLPSDSDSMPFLDGELYKHGKSLREISGQARNSVDNDDLEYIVFDCFFPLAMDTDQHFTFAERLAYLAHEWDSLAPQPTRVTLAETIAITATAQASELAKVWVAEGYEGAIMRKGTGLYQYGTNNYHSASLTKIKPIYDAEYMVVGYEEGVGSNAGAVVWVCEVPASEALVPHDRHFNVVQKGITMDERRHIFKCLGMQDKNGVSRFQRDFYGKKMTVEFPEKSTATGKPLQAKALGFRQMENEFEGPLQRLFAECRL